MLTIFKFLKSPWGMCAVMAAIVAVMFAFWPPPKQADSVKSGLRLADTTSIGSVVETQATPKVQAHRRRKTDAVATFTVGDSVATLPAGTTITLQVHDEGDDSLVAEAPVATTVKENLTVGSTITVQDAPKIAERPRPSIFVGGGYQISQKRPVVVCGAFLPMFWKAGLNLGFSVAPIRPFGGIAVEVGKVFGLRVLVGGGIDLHKQGVVTLSIAG